jgi:hypothetical protein
LWQEIGVSVVDTRNINYFPRGGVVVEWCFMEWLTIPQVKKQLNIPETSLRRYLQEYSEYIHQKKQGHKIVISSESAEVIKEIRECLMERRMTRDQVEEHLRQKHRMSLVIADGPDKAVTVSDVMNNMNEMRQLLFKLTEEMASLAEENRQLRSELEEKSLKWETKMDQLTKQLKKKPWWKRWRKK